MEEHRGAAKAGLVAWQARLELLPLVVAALAAAMLDEPGAESRGRPDAARTETLPAWMARLPEAQWRAGSQSAAAHAPAPVAPAFAARERRAQQPLGAAKRADPQLDAVHQLAQPARPEQSAQSLRELPRVSAARLEPEALAYAPAPP